MTAIVDLVVSVLAQIPALLAGMSEADAAKIRSSLAETQRAIDAIGPNAPTVLAAIERRRIELADTERAHRADEPTTDLSLGPRPR